MGLSVSDEMLMAFVDGELDAATAQSVAKAIAQDETLAERVAMFEDTRRLTGEALRGTLSEPVPQRLLDAARGAAPRGDTVVAFPQHKARARFTAPLAMAASLVLAVGIGYVAGTSGSGSSSTGLIADGRVAAALSEIPAGETRPLPLDDLNASLSTVGTFRVGDGYCRTFRLDEGARSVGGVGCERDGAWTIDLAVVQPAATDGTYLPASESALGSIDAYLDAVGAEGPLSPDEEPAGADENGS